MNLNRKFLSKALNHLPGFIILVFGMLALYTTSSLINIRENLNQTYYTYDHDLFSVKEQFHIFERQYYEFLLTPNKETLSEAMDELSVFNDRFQNVQKYNFVHLESNSKKQEHYERLRYDITQWIADISNSLASYDEDLSQDQDPSELYIHILNIDNAIITIQRFVAIGLRNKVLSEKITHQETIMYWSVIAIGFAGFLLAVLNAHKLGQLRHMNDDRKKDLEVQSKWLSALDMAKDGTLIVNSYGVLSYMNASMCVLNEIEPDQRDEYIGRSWLDIFSQSNREEIEDEILPSFENQNSLQAHLDIYQEEGNVIQTEVYLTRLQDGGFIGTVRDVSYRHQVEHEKKELEAQFYQAQKMEAIGRLAGGIAHDFNNILAAMNGYAEFLVEDLEEESSQHDFAANILKAGRQARGLVDQMLAFSRRGDNTFETIDIVSSVIEATDMLRATLPKTIEVREDFSVMEAGINGNATQISQLIMNLCVNAQDAIEDERGIIDIQITLRSPAEIGFEDSVKDDLPDPKETPSVAITDLEAARTQLTLGHLSSHQQQYACLIVRDTGCGMGRTIMEHIFEPFFTTKSVDKGTGLGLATALGTIVTHQGFMRVDSTIGKGTTFELYFPALETEKDEEDHSDAKTDSKSDESKASIKKHILVVEDQDNVREMTVNMVSRMGYQVSEAVSGMEGLDLIRENPEEYDLVLTDHNMPKMTGLEMVQQAHLDLPDLPFILLSGYSEEEIQELMGQHPAIKTILRKPIAKSDLSKELEAVLNKAA